MKWMTGTLVGFLAVLIVLVALAIQSSQCAGDRAAKVDLDFSVHQAQQQEDMQHLKQRVEEIRDDVKELLKREREKTNRLFKVSN